MELSLQQFYDVLIVGSGIAGLSAAIEAAKTGCSVAIASSTQLFSGSSFYPGTWGFGLIGPENEEDCADLAESIESIGCGIVDPNLVQIFVNGINDAITDLEQQGCSIRKADKSTQREYVPCFDHKHRNWNGLEQESLRKLFTEQLAYYQVSVLNHHALIDIVKSDTEDETSVGRICGAVFAKEKELLYIGCKALVIATGGYGSLFKNHLCTNDVSGIGQALALKTGCKLINMEFMQMMPGYISPAPNTIYNEKTFRFTQFIYGTGSNIFSESDKELLDLRSTYGPFTSRLPSSEIDLTLYRASLENPDGVEAFYIDEVKDNPPEFIKVYFDWLLRDKNVSMNDHIHIGIFSHAANGGICIDGSGWTGVEGLYACGEVTGGMHGADRIGGLSTANGLVFGRLAGKSAGEAALIFQNVETAQLHEHPFHCYSFQDITSKRKRLKQLMYEYAMIIRNEEGLQCALKEITLMKDQCIPIPTNDINAVLDARNLEYQLITATSILQAALLRKESRGSHYREDYPQLDPLLKRPIFIKYDKDVIATFEK